jgi:hypothetical protein
MTEGAELFSRTFWSFVPRVLACMLKEAIKQS